MHLEKDVLALSYAEYADAITVNTRRDTDAAETDQVMLICGPGSFTVEATGVWDTLGLRGTCSSGYRLVADEREDMVLTDTWSTVVNQTGLAATAATLNSVWLGIAESAAATAHASVRAEARRNIGSAPPGALRLAELVVVLGQARAVLADTIAHIEAVGSGADMEDDLALVLEMRDLKLSMTTLCADVVFRALSVCGLSGYKRDADLQRGAQRAGRPGRSAHGQQQPVLRGQRPAARHGQAVLTPDRPSARAGPVITGGATVGPPQVQVEEIVHPTGDPGQVLGARGRAPHRQQVAHTAVAPVQAVVQGAVDTGGDHSFELLHGVEVAEPGQPVGVDRCLHEVGVGEGSG